LQSNYDRKGEWELTIKLPSLQRLASLKNPSNIGLILKASTLLFVVTALYFQDVRIIFTDAFINESTSYVLVIPFLFAYLLYRKRKMLLVVIAPERKVFPENSRYFDVLGGILLCTASIIFYWFGSYTFTALEYHLLTLPFFSAGLTLVLFNPRTLSQAAFPFAFLGFLAPLPSEIIYGFGSTLSVVSSEASNAIVNGIGIHSTIFSLAGTPAISITQADGTVLPPFTVDIACSGIYSLIGFLVFAAFVAFIVRDKLWKKAAIFFVGFPLIYLLNILRITTILLIGYQWGEQLALSIFHLLGGWILIFLGTLLLLMISERIFKTQIFTKRQLQICPDCNPDSPHQSQDFCPTCGRLVKKPETRSVRTDVAKIVAVSLAAILILSIQVPVFALTQGPAQILVQTPTGQRGNDQVFPPMPSYTLEYVERDTDFEKLSGQDLSLIYSYVPLDSTRDTIYIGLEIAGTTGALHRWEYCLLTNPQIQGPPSVEQLDLRDVQILENPVIIARYFAFKYRNDNQTQVVLYWYENAVFTANNKSQQKYVEISLIGYPSTPQGVMAIENEMLPFATAIVNYWQPIKTWTAVAMALSSNGLILTEITIALLVAVIIFHLFETVKQRRVNAEAYLKLSPQNRQIIDMIEETERTTKPTLRAIVSTYARKTGIQIEKEELLQKLSETEKTGITETSIANVQDEPTRVWKTKMTTASHGHKLLDKWKQIITSILK
jgi:exosortase/archaeosortase family protein